MTWAISTISGNHAVNYYAASRGATKSQFVTDKLFYFECCELGRRGCTQYDLMGIGSDFSPALLGLNMFKTKFAKEVTVVAPDRDLPVKRGFYNALQSLQSVRRQPPRGRPRQGRRGPEGPPARGPSPRHPGRGHLRLRLRP